MLNATLAAAATKSYDNATTGQAFNVSVITDASVTVTLTLAYSTENSTSVLYDTWYMPSSMYITSAVILCVVVVLGIVSNILLMLTIIFSPSLKTPPNAHLVNICVNNLALSLCMILSVITLACSGTYMSAKATEILSGIQVFLTTTCLLQYWCVFTSIGYYRYRTVKKPSLSPRHREVVIQRSIAVSWTVTVSLGLLVTGSFGNTLCSITWNPFQHSISKYDQARVQWPTTGQTVTLYFILLAIVAGVCVLVNSYYRILKTLCITRSFCVNRVTPWTRAASLSSDENDLMLTTRSYKPDDNGWSNSVQPYTISNGGGVSDNFTVHYNKRTQSLTLDEVFALENPLRVHLKHQRLQATLSTTSNASMKSHSLSDFTDISPGAELQRFQRIKNNHALRNFSIRRDRISLSGATKNSLIMLFAFLLCSLPIFIVSIPGVVSIGSTHAMTTTLLICKLIFYFNSPVYPIWYLIFSKRVRKCLHRLYENLLIKMNLRQ